MKQSRIVGTGMYVPDHIVTNHDLEKMMDTSDEWIQQRTGIIERRWITEECGASDLGEKAARKALDMAGWQPEDVDFIIFATLSPDIMFPGSGCLMAAKLGLDKTPALDIRQQCTGFLYGLATADAYIKAGLARKILFVGGEVHSSGLDKTSRGRDVSVIFGDGAGAVCLEAVETDKPVGVRACRLHADGNIAPLLMTELPASRLLSRMPPEIDRNDPRFFPFMDGQAIFKKAVRLLPKVTKDALADADLALDDVNLFIPHQANKRINQAYGQFLRVEEDKIFHNIEKYGNTTAASIPIALHEAMEQGKIGAPGQHVVFAALGAGLTWGAIVYTFL